MKYLQPRLRMVDTRRLSPPPRANADFYKSNDWRQFIGGLIYLRGRRCEDPACKSPNHGAGGVIFGDHIKELNDGGAALDPANIMLRCGPCHNRKTAIERGRRAAKRHDSP